MSSTEESLSSALASATAALASLAAQSSSTASSSPSASASASAAAASAGNSQPASYKVIGIVLAVVSGLLIGSSFIFKKKGLLSATKKAGNVAGEGHPYLKSPMWWTGMIIMILGEVCNLVAYSFADAILVTPMGSIAVVTSGILAHFILQERLTTFGWIGSGLCILGSIIIALNGPQSHEGSDIDEFMKLFIAPGFLAWLGVTIAASVGMIFFVAPKYGKTHMLVYIGICSLLGGLSVACTSGLGSAILTAIRGDSSQWKHWFLYFLLVFCVVTLLLEVNYLNKALELFSTAMVTPVYFVVFTSCSIATTIILHKGFGGSTVAQIVTLILGFLVICLGITLLQLSKVDPEEIKEGMLDRRTTMLLSASRAGASVHDGDHEKGLLEDPGIDTIRGTAGAIGSIRRAISVRRSMSTLSREPDGDMRYRGRMGAPGAGGSGPGELEMGRRGGGGGEGPRRYQLYDEPMPLDASDKISLHSSLASPRLAAPQRSSTIKSAESDNIHRYDSKGTAQHLEQPRLPGEHVHRDITSPTSTTFSQISHTAQRATSPLAKEPFSAARSGSVFATSAYTDPYADSLAPSRDASFADSSKAQTHPQRQAFASSGSLAAQLNSSFAASSPHLPRDVTSLDFAPSASSGDLERGSSAPGASTASASAPPTRHRFMLPSFSRDSTSLDLGAGGHGHRVPHPKGPRDLEEQESESLVQRRDSSSEDEGEGAELRRMETYDSSDRL
ncbi:hypothetical protein JCM10213_007428 [Rhodosporidiobolus nylandii]